MSFKSFITNLWGDVEGILGIAVTPTTTLFDQLTPAEQDGAKWISGAIAVVNQNPTINGSLLIPIIQSVFPNTDLTPLIALANSVKSGGSPVATIEDAIGVIQAYLKPKTGNVWITAVQGLVSLGATIVSPATPIQKFAATFEYVYQDIIKPLLGIVSATPLPTSVSAPITIAANPALPLANQVSAAQLGTEQPSPNVSAS